MIQTVLGPIDEQEFGPALVHEHILVDFAGADQVSRHRYEPDQVFETMLPYLQALRAQGFSGFVECTPNFLGRDPRLLARLARTSGLHILTNTGLYAAGRREDRSAPYLPSYTYELSPQELAGSWLKEWYEGIEGTEVRPGFIKIGVNNASLNEISSRLVQAAALVSRRTGMVIAAHSGKAVPALESLEILAREGVAPHRHIFVHAQGEEDFRLHLEYARRGGWIEYDGVGPDSAEKHLELVLRLLEEGFENQLLISQDAGWYRPGEPGGGAIRGYTFLHEVFLPLLQKRGVPPATLQHLLVYNPARAFGLA